MTLTIGDLVKIFSETVIKVQIPLPRENVIDSILHACNKLVELMNEDPDIIAISPQVYEEFCRSQWSSIYKFMTIVGDSVAGIPIKVDKGVENNTVEIRSKPKRVDL